MSQYYVYIMSNRSKTLYTGVTNNLERRVYEHREKLVEGFTKRYNLTKLVYYEVSEDVRSAITREKQIKGWLRSKKVDLIESMNPGWNDLSDGWYEASSDLSLRSEPVSFSRLAPSACTISYLVCHPRRGPKPIFSQALRVTKKKA